MSDNIQNETQEVTLASGRKAEIKTRITARERNDLRRVFISTLKITDLQPGQNTDEKVPAGLALDVQEKVIGTLVVSFEGSTENVLERVNNGTPEDFDELFVKAAEISKLNFQPAK